jgi:hypothetical protein
MLRGRVAYFAAGAPSECFTFVKDWVEASSPAAAIGWPPLQIRTRRAPLRSYPLSAMAPDPRGPGHELYPPRVIRRDVRNGLPSCSCHDRYTQRATDLLQYIREIMHCPAASPVFYPSRRLARKSVMGEVDFCFIDKDHEPAAMERNAADRRPSSTPIHFVISFQFLAEKVFAHG